MGHYKVRTCVRRKAGEAEMIFRDEFPNAKTTLKTIEEALTFFREKYPKMEVLRMTIKGVGNG